jgi:hypothetical protein
MPNRLSTILESSVASQSRRLSDVMKENESLGASNVFIPQTNDVKSYPVTMSDNDVGKDVRTFELKTEKPDVFPSIKTAVDMAKEAAMSAPVFGGFSAKQIMEGKETAESTLFSKDREPAFKWFMMGMPDDLESINKAETTGWADLFRESPIYTTARDFYSKSGVGVNTAVEFGVNMAGEATDFVTDPASLLIASGIGYGIQKGIPKGLEILSRKYPALYSAITKELGTNKVALQEAYKTLGIEPTATEIQIKKAYNNKALSAHPDRGGSVEQFDPIQKAYDLINQSREKIFSKIYYAYKQSKVGSEAGFARVGKKGTPKPVPSEKAPVIAPKAAKTPVSEAPTAKGGEIALPTKSEIVDIVKKHPLMMYKGKVIDAYVVGTGASGQLRPDSDFDIVLQVPPQKGMTAQQFTEYNRRKLQQYFVDNNISSDDSVHPQWQGRRVDVYFTYEPPTETSGFKPTKVLKLSNSKLSPKEVAKGGIWYHGGVKGLEGDIVGGMVTRDRAEAQKFADEVGGVVYEVPNEAVIPAKPEDTTNDGQSLGSAYKNYGFIKSVKAGQKGWDSKLSPKEGTAKGGEMEPIVNIDRLNISEEAKTKIKRMSEDIKPDLKKLKGEKLTHEEVIEAAKTSEILKNGVSREATLNFEAQLLKTRQNLAALAEEKTVTKEFIDNLRAVSSAGTDIARSLESMKISAESEFATVKIKIIKDLIKLGMETDNIVKAAEGVDFSKQRDATQFYRKFVKPKFSDLIDEYRYTNMLSSPKTHIINTFSNILQLVGLNPLTKLSSGLVDSIGSQLSGKERQYYFKQVPAYYRGAMGSIGEATEKALAILRGEGFIERPDLFRVGSGIEALQVVPRLLESSDIFFRTMVYNGELEALKTNSVLTEAEKIERAKAKSEYYVFRSPIDPENKTGQGDLLATVDKLTRAAYALRSIPLIKWFIPFVQTPMNIFKQGIEYSPLGFATTKGSKDKTDQIGKALIGSVVFLWAANKGMEGKLTWAAPRGQKEKERFYASGRKPYSMLIGDTWVGYNRLGPISYPLAMAAAWQYHFGESPESLIENDAEKVAKVFTGIAQFLSDQSYLQGVGDFTKFVSGDQYAVGRSLGSLASQVIPLSGLIKWVNNFIDPFYRKTEKGMSAEAIIGNIIKNIPIASQSLPKLRDSFGRSIKKEVSGAGSVLPVTTSKQNKAGEVLYKQAVKMKQLTRKSVEARERALKALGQVR